MNQIALKVLTNEYDEYPDTRNLIEKSSAELCSTEDVPVDQVFFALILLLMAAFVFQCYGTIITCF